MQGSLGQGSLGEKLGEGAGAEVHAWAPGQVVKLFRAGVARRGASWEVRMTRAVFAAGGPAPEVLGEVTLEGRFGMVLPRFDGPTLLDALLTRALTIEQGGAILAGLHAAVHRTPPPPEVLPLSDWFAIVARLGAVPKHLVPGVLALIERLPATDGLCHGDLHTSNVIMTADGPKLIDWAGAVRAPPGHDLGRLQIMLTELVPEGVDPDRPRALNAALRAAYARETGVSLAALTASIAPHLPIARAMALADVVWSAAQREALIDSVEATLRSEGLT